MRKRRGCILAVAGRFAQGSAARRRFAADARGEIIHGPPFASRVMPARKLAHGEIGRTTRRRTPHPLPASRMGYRTLRACLRRSGSHAANWCASSRRSIRTSKRPRFSAACFRPAGRRSTYARVKGCRFPMVSNLFGTMERARFMFRDTLDAVRRLVELKVDPGAAGPAAVAHARTAARRCGTCGRGACRRGPVLAHETTIDQLPQLQSWPDDGGAFITLPQVYTEDADRPGWRHSNLGMYRVQLSGGQYRAEREVGLHYQIHRGIGVHHAAAIRRGEPLRVNIFVGGPPAMSVAAVMPLPEGLPELAFAGALGRPPHSDRSAARASCRSTPRPIFASPARSIPSRKLPEGPFGDHLGYYSLAHDFPGAARRAGHAPAGRDLAVHRRRPAAAGRHDVRPVDPRADRAGHSAA